MYETNQLPKGAWAPGHIGMAVSHSPFFIPMTSIANVNLMPGMHGIQLQFRNGCGNGEVQVSAVGMSMKLFHEVLL